MMVKVLIYAYATGVFSSRAIARKLEEDVAFRVLAAGNFPQHRTICEFRRRHLEDFERMFVEVVRVAREMGVVRFGTLSVDGTKVRANASKRKAMSYGRMLTEEARLPESLLLGLEAVWRRARSDPGCAVTPTTSQATYSGPGSTCTAARVRSKLVPAAGAVKSKLRQSSCHASPTLTCPPTRVLQFIYLRRSERACGTTFAH